MLVLTRKLQEQICIGDNVVITVLRVKGNAVRLGVEAPQDVPILRGELPRFEDGTRDDGDINGGTDLAAEIHDEADHSVSNESRDSDETEGPLNVVPRLTPLGASLVSRVEQCIRDMSSHEC